MKTYRVVTPPTSEPVTLEEAKTHLRVDDTTDDTYITALITAARQMCETYTGLSFMTQTREVVLDDFPSYGCDIQLAYGPFQSVTSVKYNDGDSVEQTLTVNTDYKVDLFNGRVQQLDGWFDTDGHNNAVAVRYQAGYASADDVPSVIKQAILMQVAAMYENRGDAGEITYTARNLLDTVKVYWYA